MPSATFCARAARGQREAGRPGRASSPGGGRIPAFRPAPGGRLTLPPPTPAQTRGFRGKQLAPPGRRALYWCGGAPALQSLVMGAERGGCHTQLQAMAGVLKETKVYRGAWRVPGGQDQGYAARSQVSSAQGQAVRAASASCWSRAPGWAFAPGRYFRPEHSASGSALLLGRGDAGRAQGGTQAPGQASRVGCGPQDHRLLHTLPVRLRPDFEFWMQLGLQGPGGCSSPHSASWRRGGSGEATGPGWEWGVELGGVQGSPTCSRPLSGAFLRGGQVTASFPSPRLAAREETVSWGPSYHQRGRAP